MQFQILIITSYYKLDTNNSNILKDSLQFNAKWR